MLLIRGQEVQRDSSRKNEISSRFMTSAHTLVFNHEGEFLPYVTKQCVVQTTTGEPEYDFENAEKFLIARQNCPSALPPILPCSLVLSKYGTVLARSTCLGSAQRPRPRRL